MPIPLTFIYRLKLLPTEAIHTAVPTFLTGGDSAENELSQNAKL